MLSLRLGAVSFVALVACAGCGGANTPAPSGGGGTGTTAWRLNAGGSSNGEAYQGFRFYPKRIVVDAGDNVTWTFASGEPHTVTFLGKGQATPPPPSDPSARKPAGGSSYDGTAYTSSGFIANGFPYTLTFPKAGTYAYYCILHQPVMQGVIVVQPRGAPYPATEDGYSSQAVAQTQSDLAAAAASVQSFPYVPFGTHVAAGIAPGLSNGPPATATVMRFLSGKDVTATSITIPLGTIVTWTNDANNAPHTVTFPKAGQPLPELPGDPFTPPMGGPAYDGKHVTNSGVMPPGASYHLKFTARGTFTYYCLFHDGEGMIGTVVVK